MNMRLLGAPTLKDVVPDMVDVGSISQHVVAVPGDRLYDANCKILSTDPCLKISDSSHFFLRRKYADCPASRSEVKVMRRTVCYKLDYSSCRHASVTLDGVS